MAKSVLAPRKRPEFQQDRARRSYDALIEAATELFARDGYDSVGTPEIAAHAGVSVGTFYRYFDDKREVYLEITRNLMATAYKQTLAGLTPDRFVGKARHETIDLTVTLLFESVLDRPGLTRSFLEMSLRDPDVAELRRAYEQLGCDTLATLISAVTTRATVPDPQAYAFVIYSAAMQVVYGLAVALVAPEVGRARARAALVAVIERALF